MPWLLNLAYLLLLAVLWPWLLWRAARTGRYRRGFAAKFLGRAPRRETTADCVWFHAVSVGEVNLLGVLIDRWRQLHPDWEVVVSTTTRTGYELACKKYAGLPVFYCPLDFSWAVGAALRRVRPKLLILAELELWPNLIRAAKQRGVRIAVVNGRLSERSFRGYQRLGPLLRPTLRRIDLIAAQNETYARRFVDLGASHAAVHVTGSVKFDGASTNRDNDRTQELKRLAGIADDEFVFLAGSTQEGEEAAAVDAFRELSAEHPRLRLILVPRHPERFDDVAKLLEGSGVLWQRRSALKSEVSNLQSQIAEHPARILLVDTIGELGAWWGTAHIAFVGGSFGSRGGQNMIEPAAYGAAVSFGPNTKNFRDIVVALLERQAAVVVHDSAELTAFVRRCLEQPDYAARLGRHARELVIEQQGAADRTITLLSRMAEQLPPRSLPFEMQPNAA